MDVGDGIGEPCSYIRAFSLQLHLSLFQLRLQSLDVGLQATVSGIVGRQRLLVSQGCVHQSHDSFVDFNHRSQDGVEVGGQSLVVVSRFHSTGQSLDVLLNGSLTVYHEGAVLHGSRLGVDLLHCGSITVAQALHGVVGRSEVSKVGVDDLHSGFFNHVKGNTIFIGYDGLIQRNIGRLGQAFSSHHREREHHAGIALDSLLRQGRSHKVHRLAIVAQSGGNGSLQLQTLIVRTYRGITVSIQNKRHALGQGHTALESTHSNMVTQSHVHRLGATIRLYGQGLRIKIEVSHIRYDQNVVFRSGNIQFRGKPRIGILLIITCHNVEQVNVLTFCKILVRHIEINHRAAIALDFICGPAWNNYQTVSVRRSRHFIHENRVRAHAHTILVTGHTCRIDSHTIGNLNIHLQRTDRITVVQVDGHSLCFAKLDAEIVHGDPVLRHGIQAEACSNHHQR